MDKHSLIKQMIKEIGDDPDREGVADTPDRVVRSWSELYGGYSMDPSKILSTRFRAERYDEMIVLKDIDFYSMCEHHILPFFGKAHIAYIPSDKVVGLSKLARLVECFSRRLQIQENMTKQIADSLNLCLRPRGVAVVVNAKHFCMVSRGIKKQNAEMTTSALTGFFKDDDKARAEFLRFIR